MAWLLQYIISEDTTMKLDTALNHLENFRSRVNDIYGAARIHGMDSAWINEQFNEKIYCTDEWKRLPRWAHSEINGFRRGVDRATWHYEILWTLELDGIRYAGKAKEFEGNYHRVCNGAHVWKQHFEKGKICFFTHPEVTAVTEEKQQ
jgi:hypothetical protein